VHDPDGSQPHAREPGIAARIPAHRAVISVTVAVDLDHQLSREAYEIEYVSLERSLPPKMIALLAKRAQMHPQPRFSTRHAFSETAGSRNGHHPTRLRLAMLAEATLPLKGRVKPDTP